MKHAVGWIVLALLMCSFQAVPKIQAQQGAISTSSAIQAMPATVGGHSSWMNAYLDILSARMINERRQQQNANRQKQIETDTSRLVDLATDLEKQMQGEKTLSPEDLGKRAAEIEKLARSVREHMRGSS
ncbi:hypothetical protein [Edaphobacter flagellatus]|uniref:hypothetical protein n=1 Tax=Edaphobacter flagellatus TaxID=1933044 RepID=UPI0021B45299|nr:hypothetical protein [Edaphobacter flagellatus]